MRRREEAAKRKAEGMQEYDPTRVIEATPEVKAEETMPPAPQPEVL